MSAEGAGEGAADGGQADAGADAASRATTPATTPPASLPSSDATPTKDKDAPVQAGVMDTFREQMRAEARRALPYGLVLMLALGLAVSVGAHLSNAFPSEGRPFGWEGPARFENAVAMVRGDLVLAASLPALLLGARALRGLDPATHGAGRMPPAMLAHALVLATACFGAGAIGGMVAFKTPLAAYVAFSTAHALLALSFYSLAFLGAAFTRRHAVAVAAGVWLFFNAAYEGLVRTAVFRQAGYHALAAGQFPSWFYVAQALSPLSAYRGVLILWERGFMDYLEKTVLGDANLPAWMHPGSFAALTLALWVALPLGLAAGLWWWKARAHAAQAARCGVPEGPA